MKRRPSVERLVEGVEAGDRALLGQAITLVESSLASDRELASELMARLAKHAGSAHRVGITGVPGVGKSTFIEALGKHLTGQGRRVAVLSIDPSSSRTGGAILGDKTRMNELARDPLAFVRPSPTSGSLGGVARNTREALALCEAAGYGVVLVETVGVGQSEISVADLVDFFLVLMLPGAGDELQGIKRGILELADLIVVNKADGPTKASAQLARAEYARALKLMQPKTPHWVAKARTCSALTGEGVGDLWALVESHREALTEGGVWEQQRADQREAVFWKTFDARVVLEARGESAVRAKAAQLRDGIRSGRMPVDAAIVELLEALRGARAQGDQAT